MADRPGIMIYFDLLPQLDLFSNEEIGQLFKAMLNYSCYGEIPAFQDRAMKTLWNSVKDKLDRDKAAYTRKCTQNRDNALKRSKNEQRTQANAANASERSQLQPETETETQSEPTTPNRTINAQSERETENEKQGVWGEKENAWKTEREYEERRNAAILQLDSLTGGKL